jgi:hypothetical protein
VPDWLYTVSCLAAPAGWGALMAWLFGLVERRRRAQSARRPGDPPPIDYSI